MFVQQHVPCLIIQALFAHKALGIGKTGSVANMIHLNEKTISIGAIVWLRGDEADVGQEFSCLQDPNTLRGGIGAVHPEIPAVEV